MTLKQIILYGEVEQFTQTEEDTLAGTLSASDKGKIIYNTTLTQTRIWNGTAFETATAGGAGATGATGPTGPQGSQGSQGIQGIQGGTGPQGTQGSAGTTGAQGQQGSQGSAGVQGTTGPTGVQGSQGSQGSAGPQGDIGLQGPQGTQGSAGIQGVQGGTGPQGTQGSQGSAGTIGVDGARGSQGSQGSAGVVGAQGATGPTGAQGSQGSQGSASTVVGPTGPQGTQGSMGSMGSAGDRGPTGPTGPAGGGGFTTLRTTADQTINAGAATYVDITGLTFPVTSGVDYAFFFYITFRSAATTTGWKSGVNHPGGVLDFWAETQNIANAAVGAATHLERHNVAVNDMTLLTATITAGVDLAIRIEGRYKCTVTGTFAARFANELAADTNIVVQKGSYGWYF